MNQKTFIEQTDKWYEYVSMDHHKDRDCHWYIEVDFQYGRGPIYTAFHQGYTQRGRFAPERETYAEAFEDLVEIFRECIDNERKWVKEVLKTPPDWDEEQIRKAEFFKEEFG